MPRLSASPLRPILFALLVCSQPFTLTAQDAALRDTFQQAKALWATQGDRDGASNKFEQVQSALEPKVKALDGEWQQVLCETYNWLAVLDDRTPAKRSRANKDLEAILDLNPDFEIDRNITNARLQGAFDALRNGRFCKVKFSLAPEGGTLSIDGKARTASPVRYLGPGSHAIAYAKPGYQLLEQHVDLAPKEAKALEFALTRVSSTITVYTAPSGVELLLDGKPLGTSNGQGGPELRPLAEPLGLSPEQLSTAFVISELSSGKHTLELKAPCYRSRRIELGAEYSAPFADHMLEPFRMVLSQGMLSVRSQAPAGELLLSGKSQGSLPIKDLKVCSGSYDLQIRFPAGGFTQRIEIPEGKTVEIEARPKPRMAFLGFEGGDEFAGRERILKMLAQFGERLKDVAYLLPEPNEKPQDALTRHRNSRDVELVLSARPVPGKPIHQIELVLANLTGEEESILVKPLEEDPLGSLATRLNSAPATWEPWVGACLLDVPGQTGPWVAQADASAQKAGLQAFKAVSAINGKPVANVHAFKAMLRDIKAERVTLTQGDSNIQVPLTSQALEIPVNASNFCYPLLLSDFRLRYLGAKGDEAGLLRLQQALVLMHFREYDKAMEVLRDAKLSGSSGVCQGTIDYYTGTCLLRLGNVYTSEAVQALNQALKYPQATLFGPEGPLVAPLAKQALEDLNP